jgi:hypothetical protein
VIAALAYKAIAADYMARMRARGLEPILIDGDRLGFECDEETPRMTDGECRALAELRVYVAMALYDKTVERRMEES